MELHLYKYIPKASAQMDFNGLGSIKCIGIKCVKVIHYKKKLLDCKTSK